jgi:molybdate/tungstate transport system substrate-binding protein
MMGLLLLAGCGAPSQNASNKTKLVMFEAGSLMVPFAAVEKAFELQNPDIDLEIQAHGSIQVIRHVTELGEDVDVVAVADSSLIPMLMYATKMDNGKPYAGWYIKPARNEFVVAYSDKSKYADGLTADNWYDILSRPDVKVGLSDPRMDAVGYRTLMVTKLAERYYGQQEIMSNTVGKYFSTPITSATTNGIDLIKVPELLDPTGNHMYFRGASLQCLALLESGDIDYSFEYISVAKQHNLKYLELPPEINLSDNNFAATYQNVKVSLDFRRFKSVEPLFEGTPIDYGITIPANSKHQKEAVRLIDFLLGPEGRRICTENYQPPLVPPQCDNIDALPAILKSFFR